MSTEREDLLISRLLDGDADAGERDELERMADRNPQVARRLIRSLGLDRQLSQAVERIADQADDLPAPRSRTSRLRPVSWIGWAAALLFAVLWGRSFPSGTTPAAPTVVPSREVAGAEVDDTYLGPLPSVLVEVRPDRAAGGVEYVVMRRFLERGRAEELREMCVDELGRPVSVPVALADLPFTESL